ncbi:fungal-specific transcription factor domain-containing protein [Xylaria cf. heliscus]|nr:fungal-specific transcription factor domain-containing protein [Xylaria cf. heliscus]
MSGQDALMSAYIGAGNTPRGRARLPSSRRRDKPQLSCNLCRRRKLKCNREQPCSSCEKRCLGLYCTYQANTELPSGTEKSQASKQPGRLQDRIQQLEDLVVDLMHKNSTDTYVREPRTAPDVSPRSVPSEDPQATSIDGEETPDDVPATDHGTMKLNGKEATYVSSGHWAAILDGISELKEYFEQEEMAQHVNPVPDTPPAYIAGPLLLLGCSRPPDMEEILASVPPKTTVDRLVSRYFNSFEMSPAILYSGQFLEEYQQFWEDPSAVPPTWLGLLFSIMCIAAQFQKYDSEPGTGVSIGAPAGLNLEVMITTFRQRIVQCLVLGRYTKGGPYVIETLMVYFTSEYFLCKDAEIGVWIVLGIAVQIAMHMGYHRDPKHFPGMSPFESEMRRRVWATIFQLDLGISAQMGMPRLIKGSQVDTEEPRNLRDSDFNKLSQEIPPSRPESELTPILYRIVKGRMLFAFGVVWDFAAEIKTHTYAEVMEIDTKLEKAHESIPTPLEWRSIAHCITDTPQMILQKIALKGIYWRARIVLHRKYLGLAKTQSQYAYSREASLDAAFKLLDYQHMLDEETQPFCQLYQDRWKVSSVVNHDFLLAASLLCSYLQQISDTTHPFKQGSEGEKIIKFLARSREIWIRSSSTSKEAQKAAQALSIVLRNHAPTASTFPSEGNISYQLQSLASYSDPSVYNKGYVPEADFPSPFLDLSTIENWDFSCGRTTDKSSSSVWADSLHTPVTNVISSMSSSRWPWHSQ